MPDLEPAEHGGVAPSGPLAEHSAGIQLLLDLEAAGAVTETSLALDRADLPYEQYEALGTMLGLVKRRTSWYLGDWLNYGEGAYGERFAQAAAATGLSEPTLLHYQFVCRNVAAPRRRPLVAFGCHALVARLEPREQNTWLKKCERHQWCEKDLREHMKAARVDQRPPLFDDGEDGGSVNPALLVEVAQAILRDAVPYIDGQHVLVPNEDMARLRAAVGLEP
jgi:hypothetical protein